MADYISEYTGLEIDEGVTKSLDNYVNVKAFGATGDSVTDDTVAIQAAIDSLPHYSHGSTMPGVTSGGGIVFFPQGKYLITDTLYFQGATIIEGESLGSALYFNPTTPKTMFQGDVDRYSRNTQWDNVTFSRLNILSRLQTSPYTQNVALDFTEVGRWSVRDCYFEGWATAIQGGAITYYHRIDNTEFFNNLRGLHMPADAGGEGSCQPVVITGGVFWSYEGDWINNPVKPSEFILTETSLMMFGTSLETRSVVEDADTYSAVRCTGNGSVTINGGYSEADFPYVELDTDGDYKQTSVNLNHNFSKTMFKLKNFTKTIPHAPTYLTTNKSDFRSDNADGELLYDLIPNGNFNNGLYGYFYRSADTTFDTSQTFLNTNGVAKTAYTAIVTDRSEFQYRIPMEALKPYYGQTLCFGILMKVENCGDYNFRVQDSPTTGYKYADHCFVDYDNGWKLFYVTYDVYEGIDVGDYLALKPLVTSLAGDGSSIMYCAGMFAWKGTPRIVPTYEKQTLYASSFPTGALSDIYNTVDDNGAWEVGNKIYNDLTATADFEGWICTVAGSPGTWKGFGAIEA